MDKEEKCKVLCSKQYTVAQLDQLADKVKEQYVVNWFVGRSQVHVIFVGDCMHRSCDDLEKF